MINILFNENGMKLWYCHEASTASKPLTLNIQNYAENFKFKYFTKAPKKMVIDSINHEGTGDFAASN
jgi:hypothetical protein